MSVRTAGKEISTDVIADRAYRAPSTSSTTSTPSIFSASTPHASMMRYPLA